MSAKNPPGKPQASGVASREYVRFIILTYGRTGSNLLASSLNGSPNIICFRELFNSIVDAIGFFVAGYDNFSIKDRALRDQDFRRFLDERIFCRHPDEIRAVGFKAPHVHFWAFPGLLNWLVEETDIRVLHLRRRNLLRLLVSLRIAEKTGGWFEPKRTLAGKLRLSNVPGAIRHPLRTANRLRASIRLREPEWKSLRAPLVLSEEECRTFFTKVEQDAAQYDHRFRQHPKQTLYYEDLLHRQRETLNQVQSFLGLSPLLLTPTTARQNPEPLRELIANYDELLRAFADTPYSVFFE